MISLLLLESRYEVVIGSLTLHSTRTKTYSQPGILGQVLMIRRYKYIFNAAGLNLTAEAYPWDFMLRVVPSGDRGRRLKVKIQLTTHIIREFTP